MGEDDWRVGNTIIANQNHLCRATRGSMAVDMGHFLNAHVHEVFPQGAEVRDGERVGGRKGGSGERVGRREGGRDQNGERIMLGLIEAKPLVPSSETKHILFVLPNSHNTHGRPIYPVTLVNDSLPVPTHLMSLPGSLSSWLGIHLRKREVTASWRER